MLDVTRFGMESRWRQHFSMESSAAFVRDDKLKGLPVGGLTDMVHTFLLFGHQPHSRENRCESGSLGCRNP